MERQVTTGWLLNFYGELLTTKQQELLNLYFNEDISLSEIATMYNVSRQAVHDVIIRGEHLLSEYEKKLGLLKQFINMSDSLKAVKSKILNLNVCDNDEKNKLDICNELDQLIENWEA